MARPYEYTHLPSDLRYLDHHIRILQVRPSLDPSSPLHCDLVESDLDSDDSGYEALSYTWGEHVYPDRIDVGDPGLGIYVTSHLATALRHFRLPLRPRRIWADAVCINQADNDEKSTQIPLMSRIYRCASRVLVWLGVGGESAARTINSYGRRLQSQAGGLNKAQMSSLRDALVELLGNSWLKRRWIIQEVVLNQDVNLFCGAAEVSWLCLLTTIDHLRCIWPKLPWKATDSLMTMYDLWKHNALRDPGQTDHGILSLMCSFDQFDCSDGRDRIYAIAALADDTVFTNYPIEPRVGMIRLSTDYTMTTEEVYTNFAASAIRSGHLTSLLREAVARRYPQTRSLLPWALDWRHKVSRCSLYNYHDITTTGIWGDAKSKFTALDVSVNFYDLWQSLPFWAWQQRDPVDSRGALDIVFDKSNRTLERRKFVPLMVKWKSEMFPSIQGESHVVNWIKQTCASLWTHVLKSIESNKHLGEHVGSDDAVNASYINLDHKQHKWLSYSLVDILGDKWSTSSKEKPHSREIARYPFIERCDSHAGWGKYPAYDLCYDRNERGRTHKLCAVHSIECLLKDIPCDNVELSPLLRAISEVMVSRRIFAGAKVTVATSHEYLSEISLGIGPEELKVGDHLVSLVAEKAATELQAKTPGFSLEPLMYIVRGECKDFPACQNRNLELHSGRHVYRFVGECRVHSIMLQLDPSRVLRWSLIDVITGDTAIEFERRRFSIDHPLHTEFIELRFD